MGNNKNLIIYQAKTGAIELKGDFKKETVWANLNQIAQLFDTDKSGISRHIKNIFKIKELKQKSSVAIFATVQKEGGKQVKRDIEYYNLDMILSVGYRVNSKKATSFRQWATKTLRSHLIQGYTINRSQIGRNYEKFMKAVAEVKLLLPPSDLVDANDALELAQLFANTWFSLDAYDRSTFPVKGLMKKEVDFTANQLAQALAELKKGLMAKKEASGLFGSERGGQSLAGIVGNVFQSFEGEDLYVTIEEKAAHLLYFIVKNHPFVDGNKRSGAFAFVWFLNRSGILEKEKMNPVALTVLTLLVAESDPKEKDRIIGLILLLLR